MDAEDCCSWVRSVDSPSTVCMDICMCLCMHPCMCAYVCVCMVSCGFCYMDASVAVGFGVAVDSPSAECICIFVY